MVLARRGATIAGSSGSYCSFVLAVPPQHPLLQQLLEQCFCIAFRIQTRQAPFPPLQYAFQVGHRATPSAQGSTWQPTRHVVWQLLTIQPFQLLSCVHHCFQLWHFNVTSGVHTAALGVAAGVVVGTMVGEAVGLLVGLMDGAGVGDPVGAFVGDPVGAFVGDPVGAFVGDPVAAFVGDPVGAFVGDPVGAFVGDPVGAFVGDPVGAVVVCAFVPNQGLVWALSCGACFGC